MYLIPQYMSKIACCFLIFVFYNINLFDWESPTPQGIMGWESGKCGRQHADVSIILPTQWWKVLTSAHHLSRPEWLWDGDYIFCLCVCVCLCMCMCMCVCVCVCVCVCAWCPENVKVFEWTILRSSVMNMITQIIYLGRAEVGDW